MTHTDRSVPATKGVDVELASASIRPEPRGVEAAPTIADLRGIAEYACWDKFEDRFTSDPKKHPAWRAADALEANARELAEARALADARQGELRNVDAELAEAREEIERLTRERDAARRAISDHQDMHRLIASELRTRAESLTLSRDEAQEALREIARQQTTKEQRAAYGDEHEADWEGGYDMCIARARSVLAQDGKGTANGAV